MLSAYLLSVVCVSARCCMQIWSVLSVDLLAVICISARCCLQISSMLYADQRGFVYRCARWCMQVTLVFSADLPALSENVLGIFCKPTRFSLQTCSVLSADLHKCESGSPMFSSGRELLGVKPCLVLTVHFHCSSSELTSLCTFLSIQSFCLYDISFFLLLHFKTTAITACKIR